MSDLKRMRLRRASDNVERDFDMTDIPAIMAFAEGSHLFVVKLYGESSRERRPMMLRDNKRALIELINDLVAENEPWTEKRDSLLELASHDELTAIEEFAAWFEPK